MTSLPLGRMPCWLKGHFVWGKGWKTEQSSIPLYVLTFIPEYTSEASDVRSSSATPSHVLGLRQGAPLLFGTS
eukprot:11369947-Alexandrium_andersonii.AAC.1